MIQSAMQSVRNHSCLLLLTLGATTGCTSLALFGDPRVVPPAPEPHAAQDAIRESGSGISYSSVSASVSDQFAELAAIAEPEGQVTAAERQLLQDQMALAQQRAALPPAPDPSSYPSPSQTVEASRAQAAISHPEQEVEKATLPPTGLGQRAPAPLSNSAPPGNSSGNSPSSRVANILPSEVGNGQASAATTDLLLPPGEPAVAPPPEGEVSTVAPLEQPEAKPLAIQVSHDEPVELGEWQETVAAATVQLEHDLARPGVDPQTASRWNAYLRLLHVVANRQQDAVEPIDALDDPDVRDFWKHQAYSLLVALDADERHAPSRRAALALRDLRTAADHLANMSTLDVRNVAFCKQVNSFGDFVEFKPYSFRPGAEVILYVEIENFAVEQRGREFDTELQGEYTILGAQRERIANVVLPLDKQSCKNRRRDYFIAYRMFIPNDIRAGEYTLVLTVEDIKGKKSNQATVGFQIR
jgi:hypothetical protein